MTTDRKQTKFETDLAAFFPDIYRIHQMGKFDKFLWDAIYSMLDMVSDSSYGEIKILYQKGRINQVLVTKSKVAEGAKKPFLNYPGTLD